jgi:hypothetical protein
MVGAYKKKKQNSYKKFFYWYPFISIIELLKLKVFQIYKHELYPLQEYKH